MSSFQKGLSSERKIKQYYAGKTNDIMKRKDAAKSMEQLGLRDTI